MPILGHTVTPRIYLARHDPVGQPTADRPLFGLHLLVSTSIENAEIEMVVKIDLESDMRWPAVGEDTPGIEHEASANLRVERRLEGGLSSCTCVARGVDGNDKISIGAVDLERKVEPSEGRSRPSTISVTLGWLLVWFVIS